MQFFICSFSIFLVIENNIIILILPETNVKTYTYDVWFWSVAGKPLPPWTGHISDHRVH